MSANEERLNGSDSVSSNGDQPAPTVKPECFVIMPISDPDGYEPGHFRRVYEDLFKPACEAAGYRAVRADEVKQTNLIHLDVLQKILESPMALCDLSSRNPNVLFELGLRQAFDKPVVLVQEVGTLPIFDINPLRFTDYRREMLYRQVIDDQRGITAAITATREAIKNERNINSIVKLLSLTHPASLKNISDTDKESALFQIILGEISTLKNALINAPRGVRHSSTVGSSANNSVPILEDYTPPNVNLNLEKYLVDSCGISKEYVVQGVKSCISPQGFLEYIDRYPHFEEAGAERFTRLYDMPERVFSEAFYNMKKKYGHVTDLK